MGAVRDPKDKSVWRWTGSGEEVSVSFWSLPQGTEEECARYDGSRGWLWSDTPCNARLNYICQHREYILYIPLPTLFMYLERGNMKIGEHKPFVLLSLQCSR